MDVFAEYQKRTGTEDMAGKCGDCANAIWRIMHSGAPEAYSRTPQNCSVACHCTMLGKPVTAYVYTCSAYAASDEAQRAEFADL